ncbi:MAG: hypothetical protein AAFR98_03725 [Pseudomonadota bacterium]
MRIFSFGMLAIGGVVCAACSTSSNQFATQREIDRCVDIVGVQESGFQLKQTQTVDGLKVTIQQFRNLTEAERTAVERCIEEQVNARSRGRAVAVENPTSPPPVTDGRLPLPTQYPLLPGDVELWAQMTREEQERALTFLAAGSTIRASLEGD